MVPIEIASLTPTVLNLREKICQHLMMAAIHFVSAALDREDLGCIGLQGAVSTEYIMLYS